ncbi:MAG TPA: hypothetical protein VE779_00710, partial [Candidatus Angelobacter sp.]|nr:hypothetical protein [Candidatus Angelobacter sp.]
AKRSMYSPYPYLDAGVDQRYDHFRFIAGSGLDLQRHRLKRAKTLYEIDRGRKGYNWHMARPASPR